MIITASLADHDHMGGGRWVGRALRLTIALCERCSCQDHVESSESMQLCTSAPLHLCTGGFGGLGLEVWEVWEVWKFGFGSLVCSFLVARPEQPVTITGDGSRRRRCVGVCGC
jgi:hypothetical protein